MTLTHADLSTLTDADLRRKADQAWDMAGLARADADHADAARQTANARAYEAELASR